MCWRELYFSLVESLNAVLGCSDILEQSDLQQCFLQQHTNKSIGLSISLAEKKFRKCWERGWSVAGWSWRGTPGSASGQVALGRQPLFIALEEAQENPWEYNKITQNNILLEILCFSSQEQVVPQHWACSHRADTGDRVWDGLGAEGRWS